MSAAAADPQAFTARNKRTHCTHLQMAGFIKETVFAPRETETDWETDRWGPYLPGSALPVTLRMALVRRVTPASNETIVWKIIYTLERTNNNWCWPSFILLSWQSPLPLIFLECLFLGSKLKTTIFKQPLLFQVYLCNFLCCVAAAACERRGLFLEASGFPSLAAGAGPAPYRRPHSGLANTTEAFSVHLDFSSHYLTRTVGRMPRGREGEREREFGSWERWMHLFFRKSVFTFVLFLLLTFSMRCEAHWCSSAEMA